MLVKLAKAAFVLAAVMGGVPTAVAQQEEELTRDEVLERIQQVEAAIADHQSKGETEHVEGATAVLESLQAALRDFDNQQGGQGGPPEGAEEDVFSILDQDQDGRISRDEFAQGFEEEPEGLWDNEDKNGDGFISYDEFGGPKGGAGGNSGGSPPQGGGASDPSEVFYVMDTDGDNRISKEEFDAHFENLGVEPNDALFKRDDQNNNGFIEFDEFGGNKNGGSGNLFAQLDINNDNKLSREEFSVEWHTAPIELFENDDKDGDGFVSFDEFGGPKGQGGEPAGQGGEGGGEENMFAILDADSDGRISSEEFNVEWHNAPEGLWEQEDRDGDGFITYDEFSGPKGSAPPAGGEEGGDEDVFSVLDQDQDGRISREEFVAGFDGPENEPEGLWGQEDANDDGFISWDEFGGPKGPNPPQRREL